MKNKEFEARLRCLALDQVTGCLKEVILACYLLFRFLRDHCGQTPKWAYLEYASPRNPAHPCTLRSMRTWTYFLPGFYSRFYSWFLSSYWQYLRFLSGRHWCVVHVVYIFAMVAEHGTVIESIFSHIRTPLNIRLCLTDFFPISLHESHHWSRNYIGTICVPFCDLSTVNRLKQNFYFTTLSTLFATLGRVTRELITVDKQ